MLSQNKAGPDIRLHTAGQRVGRVGRIRTLAGTLQIAAAFIGTIVGAGFASGREIIRFFTQYHVFGAAGILLSGLLMTLVGMKMMIYAKRIGAYSFNELVVHLFGPRLGVVIQSLIFFILFGTTGVMLAGAGAVFHEQIGRSEQSGVLLAIAISFFFLIKGSRGLLWINSLVVPMLFLFLFAVFTVHGPGPVASPVPAQALFRWVVPAIGYAAFNILTALVVMVPLARDTEDERVIRFGALSGGIGLTVLLFLAHLILSGAPDAANYQMPMAEVVRHFGPLLHLGFAAVIFGEILTTFIGNIFGLARQLRSTFPAICSLRRAMLLLVAGAFLISRAGYGRLIDHLYPFFGILCIAVVLFILRVRLPEK